MQSKPLVIKIRGEKTFSHKLQKEEILAIVLTWFHQNYDKQTNSMKIEADFNPDSTITITGWQSLDEEI